MDSSINLSAEYVDSGVADVLNQLNHELVGLKPVKTRIKEIAAMISADNITNPALDQAIELLK